MPATRPSPTAFAMYASSRANRCGSKPSASGLGAGISAAVLAAADGLAAGTVDRRATWAPSGQDNAMATTTLVAASRRFVIKPPVGCRRLYRYNAAPFHAD